MYTNYIHASNWEKSCQPNFSPILVLSFSHIYSVSPSNELYSACTCTCVCVCVCIDSSLHALSMSSLVDSLASVGISRLRALPASRFYYFYFFFFVNLFLSYIFFSLRASLYLSLFLPILFISKSGAPVHVRIFSCSFTPLKRPPRDIQKMYKLIYFYLVSVIVTTIFLVVVLPFFFFSSIKKKNFSLPPPSLPFNFYLYNHFSFFLIL